VRGENSHVLSSAEFEKMLQVNSQISGVEIKGAGHWIHYEKYAEFTEVLHNFLQSHGLHDA
jgi:pimeloyl-ACP methyl ester carboxylesterase